MAGPSAGSEIRTISIQIFLGGERVPQTMGANPELNQLQLPDGSGLGVISAIRGLTVPGGGAAKFFQGRAFAVPLDFGLFNGENPETWNFDSRFAEYALKPPEDVFPGPGGSPIGAEPAANINLSAANLVTGAAGQGRLLFREDSTEEQNMGNPGTPGTMGDPAKSGDNFLRDVVDNTPAGSSGKLDEAIYSLLDQKIEDVNLAETGLTDPDLVILNSIAELSFFDDPGPAAALPFTTLVDLDGVAAGVQAFATALGGGVAGSGSTDWTPTGVPATTGDFRADLDGDLFVGHQYEDVETAMLGDFVWDDKNANGIQDAEDATRGISGVTVKLLTDPDENGVF
ncbi:MAG: hypothetical protein GTO40_21575, partial [Deltaproteobacteria bacterium]|nr:hypothetical protein [Deltaproteobacteria bacterium]